MAGQRTVQAKWTIAGVVVGSLVFLWLATILPRTTTTVFASPDESAVAQFAGGWSWERGFRLSTKIGSDQISIQDPLEGIAGLHPRSMVQQWGRLVPVGFLGMPMLGVICEWIWRGSTVFWIALLVLSSAVPLWRMVKRLDVQTAWISVIVYLTFPTVLLYANRGLFPNLPVVALGLWAVYLLQCAQKGYGMRNNWPTLVGGALLGVAATIRPIELVWLAPWAVWAWNSVPASRQEKIERMVLGGGMCVILCLTGYLASFKTYELWIPTAGYHLSDAVSNPVSFPPEPWVEEALPAPVTVSPIQKLLSSLFPYGFHPRTAAKNIGIFLFGVTGVWTVMALFGAFFWARKRPGGMRSAPMLLTAWTFVVLLMFYGQWFYSDNIRGTATLGNSFLRYVLPIVPLLAVGCGMFVRTWEQRFPKKRWVAVGLTVLMAIYGIASGLARDEESILSVRQDLQRYVQIRDVAISLLGPRTVVLSERSDKIFVGTAMIAVSPLPPVASLKRLLYSEHPIALFHRTLTPEQEMTFAGGVFAGRLEPLVSFGNETLYRITP